MKVNIHSLKVLALQKHTDPTYILFSDEPLVALICVSTFVGQCHAVCLQLVLSMYTYMQRLNWF